jgi:DNA-binding PadR family transcriptional regulator
MPNTHAPDGQANITVTADGGRAIDRDVSIKPSDNCCVDLLHFITQSTRYQLMLDIIGHPNQAPSLQEFAYMNPDKGKTSIVEQLNKLTKHGFVDELALPESARKAGQPHKFYRLSDVGQKFLAEHNLIPADDRVIQHQYSQVKKTEKIEQFEQAPVHDAEKVHDSVDEQKLRQLTQAVTNSQTPFRQLTPDQGRLSDFDAEDETDSKHSTGNSSIDKEENSHALHWIYGCAKEAMRGMWPDNTTDSPDSSDGTDKDEDDSRMKASAR